MGAALRISDAARSQIAIMRARAQLAGRTKTQHKGKRRSSGGGGSGISSFFGAKQLGNVSLLEAGAIALIGGVSLGALFTLPVWLSPIGLALFLYGMWRKNPLLKAIGLLLVGMGIVTIMGIPSAISAKIQEAKAKGLIPMITGGAAQPGAATSSPANGNGAPTRASSGGGGFSPERIVSVIDNVLDIRDRVVRA